MCVGWEVKRGKEDDKSRHPADILLPDQRYWFFKYWPENNLKVEVMGYKRMPLLSLIEKKVLHFHLFQSLRILPRMKQYDLLIFFHSQIGIIPALFKSIFKLRIPLVLIDVEGLGRKNKWYILPFIRKAISGINYLFYLASIQEEDYQRYLPEIINRSQFLSFGVDLSRFACNGVRRGDYIISIGYLFRDWKTLIKAYSLLKTKTKLLIVGREKIEPEEIEGEKLPSGVEFIKKTDLSSLNEITSKAKFVVLSLPERRHAFGQMTLLGCMALGKAVIVSRVHGIIDYVINGENAILVEPENEQDLAEKIEYLLNKPQKTELIGQKARKTVKRFYTEEIMAKNIIEAVQRIL